MLTGKTWAESKQSYCETGQWKNSFCGAWKTTAPLGCLSKIWEVVFSRPFVEAYWGCWQQGCDWEGQPSGLRDSRLHVRFFTVQWKHERDEEQKGFLVVWAVNSTSYRSRWWQRHAYSTVIIKREWVAWLKSTMISVFSMLHWHTNTHTKADSYRLKLPVYSK